jgi:hypothetical protein
MAMGAEKPITSIGRAQFINIIFFKLRIENGFAGRDFNVVFIQKVPKTRE